MMKSIVLILALTISLFDYCNANCKVVKDIRAPFCATLFDDADCEGWSFDVPLGETKFSKLKPSTFKYQNDAESAKVRKGCSLFLYDDEGSTGLFGDEEDKVKSYGDRALIVAPQNKDAVAKDLNDLDVEEKTSYMYCSCDNVGNCPSVPPHLCAIAFDKPNCDQGDWQHHLEIPETRKGINLEFLSKWRNDIESVVVKKGCVFTGYDDTDLEKNDGFVTIDAKRGEVRKNLVKGVDKLADDIESFTCIC